MTSQMKSQTLSVTIIALNEEKDLPRCLKSVQFADEIILMDTGSSDKTIEVAKAAGAKVVQSEWRGYGAQKNLAQQHVTSEWVLNLDADEEIPENLKNEILSEINSPHAACGYAVARKTFFLGKWIQYGGWYPNYVMRLARTKKSKWSEPNVHEVLEIDGETRFLKNPLNHFTFSDIDDQVRTNLRYAKQGALDQCQKGKQASIAKLLFKPAWKFFQTYFLKKGFLDGWPGFIISINAAYSMFLKFAFLGEMSREKSFDSRLHHR